MSTVDIHEASFSDIATCASITLLGKRRTGKTTWAIYICKHLKSRVFIVMCGNKDNMSEWSRVVAPIYVQDKNIDYLKRVRDCQDRRCSMFSSQQLPIPESHRITLIFDDCGYDRKFMHSEIMRDILSNGRHYGMYVIILCQYLNQMHSVNRDQLDYVGILYTSNITNLKKLYNEYLNVCGFHTFKAIVQGVTDNRGICWIDNTKSSSILQKCVYYYHLKFPLDPVRLGSSNTWNFSERYHLSDERQRLIGEQYGVSEGGCTNFDTDDEKPHEDYSEVYQKICIPNTKGEAITIRKMKMKLE